MNPIRWFHDVVRFLRFAFPRKDKTGKISGFLYQADDVAIPDYHETQEPFGRRIFMSYARSSLPLARRFEDALRIQGLEPWRYKPEEISEDALAPQRGVDNFTQQLRYFEEHYPDTLSRLPATLRRCSAVLFLVSEDTQKSVMCELEAFTAMSIHAVKAKSSAVYVILENPGSAPSPWLSQFWTRVYEEGLEESLAELIAAEIESHAAFLKLAEEQRGKRYR